MGINDYSTRLLGFLLGILVVFTLAVTVLGFAGRWHWYADLFNHLRPQYAIVFMFTFMLGIWARRRGWTAVSFAGLLLNALVLVPHAIPTPAKTAESAGKLVLHVATINLLVSNPDHETVSKLLRETLPDIVVLQEAGQAWVDTLESLKDVYPHQRVDFHRHSFFGLAILSRMPWENAELAVLGKRSDAKGLEIRFQWDGRSVSLMDMHAYHPTSAEKMSDRMLMQESLIRWSSERQKAGDAVIIAGDFNCTPWAYLFRNFIRDSGLADSSQGRLFEATRNVWYPDRLLIDHLFYSRDWVVARRQVGPAIGSDHRPVFVDLALTR